MGSVACTVTPKVVHFLTKVAILFNFIKSMMCARRAKRNGLYPLKLRVYYAGKTIPYPTVYNLTKEEFSKLGAKRLSDSLGKLRQTLQEIERRASDAAQTISPFNFETFYVQFIYSNSHFQIKKKAVNKITPQNSAVQKLPEEWLKRFPVLKELQET